MSMPTISADEIAALLNFKPANFRRRRGALIKAGMPRPIPGGNNVWSRANVLAWIDRAGQFADGMSDRSDMQKSTAAPDSCGPQQIDIEEAIAAARQRLERRIGGAA